ncbi:MAG: YciI family protein [Sphingomonadaceae bacterium]
MPDASDEGAPLPAQAAGVKAAAGSRFVRAGGFWTGRRQLANVEAVPVFAIHCIDKPMQQSLRASTRAEHLAYLESQIDRVVVAGPLLDDEGAPIGSMMLMDFPDRRAAVAFAADDPYAKAGLFASVAVTAWRQVLPRTS